MMCIAVDLNERTVKAKKGSTNRDVYIALKDLWFHNPMVRCYEFPVIAHENPFDEMGDIVMIQDYGWNVDGAEQETNYG